MIFSILIIIAVGLIAFFHYAQGLFSATISAVLSVIAAVVAFSYHETLGEKMAGKMGTLAHPMALLLLFTVIYLVLRTIVDKLVPGNVALPVMLNNVGGAAMGLIAGVFAAGVIAIAAEEMPFGPAVAGYGRYAMVGDRAIIIPQENARSLDSKTFDELKSDNAGSYDPADLQKMYLPVDDILVGFVQRLSDGGALAGDQILSDIHPDLPEELFGQRLGIQIGANRIAMNPPVSATEQVKVAGAYRVGAFTPVDSGFKDLRKLDLGAATKVSDRDLLVALRVKFTKDASDTDSFVRFSPASARLVTLKKEDSGVMSLANYYPLGSIEDGTRLYVNKMDDFLFADLKNGEREVDLVYRLDQSAIAKGSQGQTEFPAGSFLEVKRLGRVSLAGTAIGAVQAAPDKIGLAHMVGTEATAKPAK